MKIWIGLTLGKEGTAGWLPIGDFIFEGVKLAGVMPVFLSESDAKKALGEDGKYIEGDVPTLGSDES